ncbi:unnamed protein product [Blepharisma stoltei]|uniref:Ribosomal protein S15 n=1 Tax=Blepharisma stoltei TaxID=1481888 RepID=A0AAU9IM08_9CILI|nr:unnamed protein product [Blepharisma stoltei]
MIRSLSRTRLSVPLPQWEKIVPKDMSKIFLKNKRRLKSHRADVPPTSDTIKLRNNFERSPTKFDSLYEHSPGKTRSKLLSARNSNKTIPLPDDSPDSKSPDRRLSSTRLETYNFDKESNTHLEREVKSYKKIIVKNLREIKGREEALLTDREREGFVKSFSDLKPKMYTMTKGGSNYRRSLLRKKFDNFKTDSARFLKFDVKII